MTRKILLCLAALLATAVIGTAQTVLAQWNFNGLTDTNSPAPSIGAGAVTLQGGVTGAYVSGTGSSDTASPNSAFNITKFPAQGSGAQTAGIQFAVSTVGYDNIVFSFDFRASNTGANNLAVLYTTDGSTFQKATNFVVTVPAAFTNQLTVSLNGIPGVKNNANFAVRVVSDFAAGTSAYAAVNSASSYSSSGTWRFDMATISGSPASEGGGDTAPTIVGQPQSLSVPVGSAAAFSVIAAGTSPLSYQWNFGTGPILGATAATLSLPNVSATNAGTYFVVITNTLGSVTSAPVTLTVTSGTSIIATNIAYLHTLLDPVNYNPTDTTNLYQVEGIVTTFTNMTSGTANASFYIEDSTAGVAVFWSGGFASLPPAGAKVSVVAPLSSFNGLLELAPSASKAATSVTVLSTNNPLPAPVPLDFTWQNDIPTIESHEGQLVVATNVTIDQTATGGIFASGKNITMTSADGSSTLALFVNAGTDLVGQPIPTGPVTVIGVLGQYVSSNPRTTGYELIPSRYADVQSQFKPPTIAHTNYLSNLVRPGDAPTNTFTDFGLRPGEQLTVAVTITDPSGKPFTVSTNGTLPTGGIWSLSSFSADAGGTITGTFTCTASGADAGNNFPVTLAAQNDSATNQLVVNVYVPTAAEQRVLISEFYANPTTSTNAPNFNPLHRDTYPATTSNASPGNLDEFVEVLNLAGTDIQLLQWTLADAVGVTHRFYDLTTLTSSNAFVIYGGPLNGFAPKLPAGVGSAPASEASGGRLLALNDAGDTITLRNASSNVIARVVYTASDTGTNSSSTRFPTTESGFVAHRTASDLYASPGLQPDGELWSVPSVPPVTSITVSAAVVSGGLTLTWNTVAGATYTVARSATADGTYQPLQSGLTAGSYTDSVGAGNAFYRISSP